MLYQAGSKNKARDGGGRRGGQGLIWQSPLASTQTKAPEGVRVRLQHTVNVVKAALWLRAESGEAWSSCRLHGRDDGGCSGS